MGAHLPDLRQQDRLVNTFSFPNLTGSGIGRGGADAAVRRFMTIVLVVGRGLADVVADRWLARGSPVDQLLLADEPGSASSSIQGSCGAAYAPGALATGAMRTRCSCC